MRRVLCLSAAALALLAAGCDRDKQEGGGLVKTPEAARSRTDQRPVPESQTFYAAKQSLEGGSAETGATLDPGRVVFDGDKRGRVDLIASPAVKAPAADGRTGKTVAYTAPRRLDTLPVGEVPAPDVLLAKADGPDRRRGSSDENGLRPAGEAWSTSADHGRGHLGEKDGTAEASSADPACGADMAALPGFCIDRYEAPNKAGSLPMAFKTAPEGEAWCRERGKRLCTEKEWTRACRGPQGWDYPYGPKYEQGRCNDDRVWRQVDWGKLGLYPADEALGHARALYQADPSGSRKSCATPEGVHDLTGNVAEWVRSPASGRYPDRMKGCYWSGCYRGVPSCGFANTAHPGTFRSYEAGFRCCKDR